MRRIYSTELLKIEGIEILGIKELPLREQAWIHAARKQLLRKVTLPEKVAAHLFSLFGDQPTRQAFFKIRGRSYFLDFFFPLRMLAVEIDGFSHLKKKEKDRRRDADFRSVGIRTVRLKNKDVMAGRGIEILARKLYHKSTK